MPDTDHDTLNARIAELLFGIVDEPCTCGKRKPHTAYEHYGPPADYAGSWEGAGLVLEAMRAPVSDSDGWARCRRFRNALYRTTHEAMHGTNGDLLDWEVFITPEAIASAALAVLEAEAAQG